METPIYDSTKQSFKVIEQQIDNFNKAVDQKINDAIMIYKIDNKNIFTNNFKKNMYQYVSLIRKIIIFIISKLFFRGKDNDK